MAFDAEGYRKAAKDAGLSDEEIQKDIDEETKGIAAKGADADMANVKVGQDFMGIPEWLQPAAGLATAAALGAGATGLGIKLKDRMSKPEAAAAPRVEPTFGIPEMEPQAQPQAQPQGKFTPPQGDVTDVASRPVGDPRLQIGGPKALPAPEVAVPTAAAPAPSPTSPTAPAPDVAVAPPAQTPAAPVQPKPMTEIERLRIEKLQFDLEAARAKEARAQEAHATRMANEAKRAEAATQKRQGQPKSNISAKDSAIIADNNEVKARAALVAAGQPKPPTASPVGGTSLPVGGVSGLPQGAPPAASVAPPAAAPVTAAPVVDTIAPVESVKPPAKAPKAKLEMPEGWGKGMSWLVNQHGVEGAQDFVNRYNDGKPFATYDDMMKSYQENTTRPKYSDIPKDVRKSRGIAPPKQSGVAGKAAGIAGAALLLPTIGEAAQATKEGDTQKARANIMEWLNLHPVSAMANQFFGTSPEELETLRKAERSRKVGAGRGIAPPSAYQR